MVLNVDFRKKIFRYTVLKVDIYLSYWIGTFLEKTTGIEPRVGLGMA